MIGRLKYSLIFYFVVSYAIQMNLFAQEQRLRFDNISVKEGLSQISVNTLVQDKYGFLWFGTQDGLDRFDGYDFKVFKHDPLDSNSISDSYINALYKDSVDILWIGTELGLNKYDYNNEVFIDYKHIKGDENSLDNNYISVIYEAPSKPGILWIGTKHGLNRFDTKNETFTRISLPNSNILNQKNYIVNTIYEAPSEPGVLWIGTPVGLLRYDIDKQDFNTFLKSKKANSISDNYVNVIFEDNSSNLWIGTSNGLNIYDRKRQKFFIYYAEPGNKHSLGHNNVSAIYQDNRNNLWFGTWGNGISLFDKKRKTFTNWANESGNPQSISSNFITQIYEDNSGILWFATQNAGINKMNPNVKKIRHYYHNPNDPNSLAHSLVHSIMIDNQGVLWIGTIKGITTINEKTGKYTHFQHDPGNPNSLSDNQVRYVLQSKDGIYWIGTKFGGLNKYDPVKKTFKHFKPDPQDSNSIKSIYVRTIFEDENGILWLGTINGGLSRFDPKTEQFKNYTHDPDDQNSINDDRVYSIIKGEEKNMLWMATGNGIASFDNETEQFTRYYAEPKNPEGLSYHLIMSIMKDHEGIIWVATYGGGLNRFDPNTGIFNRYSEKDGLPNNVVYGIIEDEHYNLWLSTNKGISVFNKETREFKNYSVEDGLQDNEFNSGAYFKDKSGNIYFGGMEGVNRIKPDKITDNLFIPPVVIHDFQLFNKSVSPFKKEGENKVLSKSILETDIIKLSYKENSFSFLFAALDYSFPDKNEYMYILENFDKDWTKVTNRRFVTYTSLPAGEYTFKVKGSNSDGIWNEEGRSIKLIIEPPFWETWWFRLLLVVFIVSSLVSFYLIRTKEIKRINRELETTVQDRTREIQEKNYEISAQNEELKKSKDEIEIANKKLKKLNQFKEEMAGMIVHDLKNPLNLIIGLAENKSVKQSGKQMLNMVMNILDVQKYEQTEIKLQKANIQANLISKSALEQVCLLYEQKNIKIENLVNKYVVVVDPDLIERVFVNILTNAIKYTPINGKIALESEKSEDEFIQIKITDNGPGIPKDKLEKIFLKFEQVVAKESGIARSTGMGLTFCKMVIEAHGGKIGVESELDKGTSFWFNLPAGQETNKINHTKTKQIEETSLKLAKTDKEVLRQYALKLQNLEVYELSDIEKIINLIDISESQNLGRWKKEMDNALHTMNQEKYLELIKLIEE